MAARTYSLIFPDGALITGTSFGELEQALRATQMHTYDTRRAFRAEMRRRAELWTGRPAKPVIYQTSKAFILQLVHAELCMLDVSEPTPEDAPAYDNTDPRQEH